jgi:uncharacterized membrane protein
MLPDISVIIASQRQPSVGISQTVKDFLGDAVTLHAAAEKIETSSVTTSEMPISDRYSCWQSAHSLPQRFQISRYDRVCYLRARQKAQMNARPI